MEHYFLKTGFNFDYLNGKLILPFEDLTDSISGSLHRKYNLRYLEIPLTFKMRTNQFGKFAIYGHIGFGAGFILDFTFNNGLSNILKDDVKIKGVDKGYIHYFQLNIGVMF
jgi:hypothetical protein